MSFFQILLLGIGILFILSSYTKDVINLVKKGYTKLVSFFKRDKANKKPVIVEKDLKYPISDAIISWEQLSEKINNLGLKASKEKLDALLEFMVSEYLDNHEVEKTPTVVVEPTPAPINPEPQNMIFSMLGDKNE
jgi:hypothetical protein